MKRLLILVVLAATLVLSAFVTTAGASYNTYWYCPTNGQIVNAGGGYAYFCSNHHWWVIP